MTEEIATAYPTDQGTTTEVENTSTTKSVVVTVPNAEVLANMTVEDLQKLSKDLTSTVTDTINLVEVFIQQKEDEAKALLTTAETKVDELEVTATTFLEQYGISKTALVLHVFQILVLLFILLKTFRIL